MNIPESDAETASNSDSKQENGDANVESERPLKKARFAWQVKGKYHLKHETSENKPISNPHEASSDSSSDTTDELSDTTEVIQVNTDENLDKLGDYLFKQDFNALESISETNKSEIVPKASSPSENLSFPKYVSSCSTRNENCTNRDSNNTSGSSVNNSINYIDDEQLVRWQSRQMTNCYIDNTINRVLDNWMIIPLPITVYNVENRTVCLNETEETNNYQGDNNTVENEGILMAISAHGLQNTSNSSNDSMNCNSDGSPRDLSVSSPSSFPSDDEQEQNNEDDESLYNEMEMSCLCSDNIEETVNNEKREISNTSSQSYNENVENSNEYGQKDDFDDMLNNHFDFMDAAVSYAIQYKGLTSFGTDG